MMLCARSLLRSIWGHFAAGALLIDSAADEVGGFCSEQLLRFRTGNLRAMKDTGYSALKQTRVSINPGGPETNGKYGYVL